MKNLKNVRESRNMTQGQVAKILNVTQQAYSRYENNIRQPSFEIIIKLAKYFNVSIDYLLDIETPYTFIDNFLMDISTKIKNASFSPKQVNDVLNSINGIVNMYLQPISKKSEI